VGIAAALAEARRRVEAGESLSEPQHLAPAVADAPAASTPAEDTRAAHVAVETPAAAAAAAATDAVPAAAATEPAAEPAAFGWEPAPITQWTDLRKPVTGEFPLVSHRSAA
jgi:hypothetical protein